MGRQYVRLTKEVVYNTFPTSPATGTQVDLFLPSSNAMGIRPTAQFSEISDAGVGNRPIRKKVGRITVGGSISTYFFPSQAGLLLGLAADLGSGTCLNIPSFSVDHAVVRDFNCGVDYRRYTGCKIANFALKSDNTEQGCLWSVQMDIVGSTPVSITSTDFATPLLSAYPADDPYTFYETSGKLTVGSVRTNYQSLDITIANMVKSFADEGKYASAVDWFGRRNTLGAKLRYKSTADRLAYEAGTHQAVSLAIDDGTTTTTLDFGTKAIIDTPPADDFPIDDYFTQMLSLTSLMDPTIGTPTDLTITVAADA